MSLFSGGKQQSGPCNAIAAPRHAMFRSAALPCVPRDMSNLLRESTCILALVESEPLLIA